jgi:hypothetical protein
VLIKKWGSRIGKAKNIDAVLSSGAAKRRPTDFRKNLIRVIMILSIRCIKRYFSKITNHSGIFDRLDPL